MKKTTILILIFILLVIAAMASFLVGRYPVSFQDLIAVLTGSLKGTNEAIAILNIRLPRIILAILVGMCLGGAGAAYQGVFQNPMAAPDILGASAGAGFGAALAILIGLTSYGITLLSFISSLVTVAIVIFVSKHTKGERVLGLILAGIMVSSLFQSGTSFIKLIADPTNKLPAITYWLMGSLAGVKMKQISFIIVPMIIGLIPLLLLSWKINILTLGDEEAKSLGVDAGKVRALIITAATLTTASAVSISGMIGWVGLVVPHMMRRIVGNDYRYLMPASLLGGGLFMLIVDNFARNISTSEIPIGILTAFVGAPFFLLLITRREEYR